MTDGRHVSVNVAAVVGLASLAAAMGIGRFAFTPIFPMMQEALDELSAERDLPVIGSLGPREEESEVVEELEHGGLEREVEAAIEAESSPHA